MSESAYQQFRSSTLATGLIAAVFTLTISCVVYNLSWIKQRREYWMTSQPIWSAPALASRAPGMLWLFGETAVATGCYIVDDEAEASKLRRRLAKLFPEADELIVMTREENEEYVKSLDP